MTTKTTPRIAPRRRCEFSQNITDTPRASARCTRIKSAGSSPGRGTALRPSCPPRSRAMVELDPSSRRRPLSFTRAGASWWIIDPTATPAGPCGAIFGSYDAEDRQRRRLLLLPTLCLLRCLLRRCFRLSLLRHCCPPSLSGWRHRYSAVANRLALASAYTSGEKKTAFPLNFVHSYQLARTRRARGAIDTEIPFRRFLRRRDLLRRIRNSAKVPVKCGFLQYRLTQRRCTPTLCKACSTTLSCARRGAQSRICRTKKILR
jgi:hypothetical protein